MSEGQTLKQDTHSEAFDNYHKKINAGHCVHVSYIDGNARVLSGRVWVIMTFDSVKDALLSTVRASRRGQ